MEGPQSTGTLRKILVKVEGLSLRHAFLAVVGPFPIAGLSYWSNDWHAYRPCPYPHIHKGLDLLAPRGTPAVAAASGYVSQVVDGSTCGLGLEITDGRGTQYFYCHLEALASGMRISQPVRVGQVVGFVGNTGNAVGGVTHLHFEVQPGGIAVPPKPYVDQWLLLAERRARYLVRHPSSHRALAWMGRFGERGLLTDPVASVGTIPEPVAALAAVSTVRAQTVDRGGFSPESALPLVVATLIVLLAAVLGRIGLGMPEPLALLLVRDEAGQVEPRLDGPSPSG
jgi:murein DD-endopeptidase MepM/ murein hydrolase activator NlpD